MLLILRVYLYYQPFAVDFFQINLIKNIIEEKKPGSCEI